MMINFFKGSLAAFWLLAVINLIVPSGEAWYWPINTLALLLLLIHVVEIIIWNKRIKQQPNVWLARIQVMIFGVLQLKDIPKYLAEVEKDVHREVESVSTQVRDSV